MVAALVFASVSAERTSLSASSRRLCSLAMLIALLAAGTEALAAPLALEDYVRLALARAPAVRAAAEEARAANERVRAAAAAYMPRLTGAAEYGVARGFDEAITNGGTTALLVGVELPVLDGGFRAAQWEGARARLQSSKALEQQRRADVVLRVRTAYLTGVAGRAQTDIQADAASVLREYVGLLREQEVRGLVPRTDVLRAELAVETARSAQRAAEAAAEAAGHELSVLTGVEIGVRDLVEPAAPVLTEPSPATIEASPVISDAKSQAEAARRDADAVRSEQGSHVTLTADAGFLGVQPDRTFRDNGGGQFLLGFRLPIYDGGAANARAAAALATAASSEANVEQLRQTVTVTLAQLQVEAERARADAQAWQDAAPRAVDAFQLMRARYFGGGNVRLLEVLDALAQVVESRMAVVRGQLAYELALATQDQVMGVTP